MVSSGVTVPTLVPALVYLRRLKSRLRPGAGGLLSTPHRAFLASLADKYLNDSSIANKDWAKCSIMSTPHDNFGFRLADVNRMERELLSLPDWDLSFTSYHYYFVGDTSSSRASNPSRERTQSSAAPARSITAMVAKAATSNSLLQSSNDEAPEVLSVLSVLLVLSGTLPTRPKSVASLVKLTLIPVPLVQVELTALLAPETKLTTAHYASHSLATIETGVKIWSEPAWNSTSTPWTTMPMKPFFPT